MSGEIFGYFDDPTATVPTFDPGFDVACPFCLFPLEPPMVTISLMAYGPEKRDCSYFYRAHKFCFDNAKPERVQQIESSVID